MTHGSRRTTLPALVTALLLTAGCGGSEDPEKNTPIPAGMPALEAGQRALVDRYSNRLLVFDEGSRDGADPGGGVVWEESRPQTFTYSFADRSVGIVTVGDSDGGDYQILRLAEDRIDPVLTVRDAGVFPLASSGGRLWFLLNEYDTDGRITSSAVATLRGSRLDKVPNLRGAVTGATVADGRLWFTTYAAGTDDFDLWSVPPDDPTAAPRREGSGLRNARLYTFRDQVVTDDSFGSRARTVDCSVYCAVDDEGGRVYALEVADAELVLRATHVDSGRDAVVARGDLVDFEATADAVTVYDRTSGVHTVTAEALP